VTHEKRQGIIIGLWIAMVIVAIIPEARRIMHRDRGSR